MPTRFALSERIVTVDAASMMFAGDVRTVLGSPCATLPPKTLEEARNQPGRCEQIESQGISGGS